MKASFVTSLLQGEPDLWCAAFAERHNGFGRLPIPGKHGFWVVSDPQAISTILTDRQTYDKGGPFYQIIARALGADGLFTTNDEWLWRRLHDAIWPSLRSHELVAANVGTLASDLWLRRMDAWDVGVPIELFTELKEFSIELLAAYLFGVEVDSRKLARLTRAVFAGMAGRIFLPVWAPGGRRYARVVRELMDEIDAIIESRRASLPQGTLLDSLLHAEPAFTSDQIRDQVMTMLMAGHDSTATVLAWAFIRLSEDEELYADLRQEALQSNGVMPTPIVQTIRAASHEHPAFPMFPRNVTKPTRLLGHRLHKGDQIAISLYGMHHTEGFAQTFAEFLEADQQGLTQLRRGAHLPFGAGRRKCPGEDFAMHTGSIVLSLFLREFSTIRRPAKNSGEHSRYAMTAPPRDNAAMWLRR